MTTEVKREFYPDLEGFHRHLVTLLDADLPLPDGISLYANEARGDKFREALKRVAQGLRQGKSLSDALAAETRFFPKQYVAIIRVGEKGGNLLEALELAIEQESFQCELRDGLRKALCYPILVFVVVSVAYGILVALSYPVFINLYAYYGSEIPLPARMGMAVYGNGFSYFIIGAVIVLAVVTLFYQPNLRRWFHGLWLRVPVVGTMLIERFIASFSDSVAILIRSGLSLPDAMWLAAGLTGNRYLRKKIEDAARGVRDGKPLSRSLDSMGIFPELFVSTAAIGEDGGSLADALSGISGMYKSESLYHARVLVGGIDLAMVMVLGVWVLLLLTAMYSMYWRLLQVIDSTKIW